MEEIASSSVLDPRHHLGPRESSDHMFAAAKSKQQQQTTSNHSSGTTSPNVTVRGTTPINHNTKNNKRPNSSRSSNSSKNTSPATSRKNQPSPAKSSSSHHQQQHRKTSPSPPNKAVSFSKKQPGVSDADDDAFDKDESLASSTRKFQQSGQHYSAWWESNGSKTKMIVTKPKPTNKIYEHDSSTAGSSNGIVPRINQHNNHNNVNKTSRASPSPSFRRSTAGAGSTSNNSSKDQEIFRNSPPSIRKTPTSTSNAIRQKSPSLIISSSQMAANKTHHRRNNSPPTSRDSPSQHHHYLPSKLPCVAHPSYTGHKDCGCLVGWSPPQDRGKNPANPYENLPPVIVHKERIQQIGALLAAPRLRLIVPHHDPRGVHFPTVLTCESGASQIWERHVFTGEPVSSTPVFTLSAENYSSSSSSSYAVNSPDIFSARGNSNNNNNKIASFCSVVIQVPALIPKPKGAKSKPMETLQLLWVGCDQGSVRVQVRNVSRNVNSGSSRKTFDITTTESVVAHRGEVSAVIAVPENIRKAFMNCNNDANENDEDFASSESNFFPLVFSASNDGQLKCWGLKRIVSSNNNQPNSKIPTTKRHPTMTNNSAALHSLTISYKIFSFSIASHLAGFRCLTLLDLSPQMYYTPSSNEGDDQEAQKWLLCAGCTDGLIKCWDVSEVCSVSKDIEKDFELRKSLSAAAANNNNNNTAVAVTPLSVVPTSRIQSRSGSFAAPLLHHANVEPFFVLKGHNGAIRSICAVRSEIKTNSSSDRFHHTSASSTSQALENNNNNNNGDSSASFTAVVGVRREIWTGSDDKTIKIWSIPSLEEAASLRGTISPSTSGHRTPICSLTTIRNHSMWSTDEEGRISIYKLDTLQLVHANDTNAVNANKSKNSGEIMDNNGHLPSVTAILPLSGHIVWLSSAEGTTNAIYVPGSLPKSNIDPKQLTDLQDALADQEEKMFERDSLHCSELDERFSLLQTLVDEKFTEFNLVLDANFKSSVELIESYGPHISNELNQEFINLVQQARIKIDQLQERNTELVTGYEEMKKIAEGSTSELESTKSKNKELNAALVEAKKKLTLAEGRFIKTRDDMAKEVARADRLEYERPRLQQTAEEAEEKASEQLKRAVAAEAKIRFLKEETTRSQQKATLVESQMKKLQQSVDDLSARLKDQNKISTEAEEAAAKLMKEKAQDAEKLANALRELKTLQEQTEADSKTKTELLSSLADTKKTMNELIAQAESSKQKFEKAEEERLSLGIELRDAKTALEQERAKSKAQEKKLSENQENAEANEQHELEKSKLRELAAAAEERASRQAVELDKKLKELENQLEQEKDLRRRQELESQENDDETILRLKSEMKELEEKNAASKSAVDDLQREKQSIDEKYQQLKDKHKIQVDSNHQLVQLAEAAENQVADLRRQLDEQIAREKEREATDFVEPSPVPDSPTRQKSPSPSNLEKLLLHQSPEVEPFQQQHDAVYSQESEFRSSLVQQQSQEILSLVSNHLRATSLAANNLREGSRTQEEEQETQKRVLELQSQQQQEQIHKLQVQVEIATNQRDAAIRESQSMRQESDDMIKSMKRDLESYRKHVQLSGNEQITALQKQLEEHKDSSSKKLKKASKELEDCKEELDSTQKQLEKQTATIRDITPKLQSAEDDRDKLKKNLASVKKEYDEFQKKSKDQQDQTNEELVQVKSELDGLRSKLSCTQSQSGEQETQLEFANKKIVSLMNEVEQSRTELRELHDLKTQLTRSREAHTNTKNELEQTMRQLEDTRARLDSFRHQMDSLSEDFESATRELTDTKSAIADYEKSEKLAKEEMKAAQKKATAAVQDAQEKGSQLATVRQEKHELERQLFTLRSEHSAATQELTTTKSRNAELDQQLATSQRENAERQEEFEKMKKEYDLTAELFRKLQENFRKVKVENSTLQEELQRSADAVRREMEREMERHRHAHVMAKQKFELTSAELDDTRKHLESMQRDRDDVRSERSSLQIKLEVADTKLGMTTKQLEQVTNDLERVSGFNNALQIQLSQKTKELEAATFALNHARTHIGKASEETMKMKQDLFLTNRELQKKSAACDQKYQEFSDLAGVHQILVGQSNEMKDRILDYEEMEKHYNVLMANLPPPKVDGDCQTDLTSKDISRLLKEVHLRHQQVIEVQKQLQELLDSGTGDEETRNHIYASFTLDSTLFPHDKLSCLYCNGCLCLRAESDFKSPGRQRMNLNSHSVAVSRISRETLRSSFELPTAESLTERDDLRAEIKARNKGLPPQPKRDRKNNEGRDFGYDISQRETVLGQLHHPGETPAPKMLKKKSSSSASPSSKRTKNLLLLHDDNEGSISSVSPIARSPANINNNNNNNDDADPIMTSTPQHHQQHEQKRFQKNSKNRASSSPVGSPTNPVGEKNLKRRLGMLIRAFNNNQSKQTKFELSKEISRIRAKLAEIAPEYANAGIPSEERLMNL